MVQCQDIGVEEELRLDRTTQDHVHHDQLVDREYLGKYQLAVDLGAQVRVVERVLDVAIVEPGSLDGRSVHADDLVYGVALRSDAERKRHVGER